MADTTPPASSPIALDEGRCHLCGYDLRGKPPAGVCPECGTSYTAESAARLRPWPGAASVCVRLGWPLVGLLAGGAMMASGDEAMWVIGALLGWLTLGVIAINGYKQVRGLLKRCLPERTRTTGMVAALRALGTVAVVLVVALVALPIVLGAGCLLLLSTQ